MSDGYTLNISPALRQRLRQVRERQLKEQRFPDEVFKNQEVVILTLGLGPAMYLTLDGRIIIWDQGQLTDQAEDPRETVDLSEIAAGLLIGAKRQSLPELLDLLPVAPEGWATCHLCEGTRTFMIDRVNFNSEAWIVCPQCAGMGRIDPEMSKSDDQTL